MLFRDLYPSLKKVVQIPEDEAYRIIQDEVRLLDSYKSKEEEVNSLKAQIVGLETQITTLTSSISVLSSEKEAYETWMAQTKERIAQLEARIAQLEAGGGGIVIEDNSDLPPPIDMSKFLLYEDYSSGVPVDGKKYVVEARGGYTLDKDSDGKTFLISRLASDQPLDGNKRVRNEFTLRDPGNPNRIFQREPWNSTRWYGVKLRIPSDWEADPNKILLWQVHGTEDEMDSRKAEGFPGTDEGKGRNPCLALQIWNTTLEFRHIWDDYAISPSGLRKENMVDLVELQYERNKWYTFIVKVVWDWRQPKDGGKGEISIWESGNLLVSKSPYPQGYNDLLGPYVRIGGYWPSAGTNWPKAYVPTMEHKVHYGPYIVGGDKCTLQDMMKALK